MSGDRTLFLVVIFIISLLLYPVCHTGCQPLHAAEDGPDCTIDRGPCVRRIDNQEIALDISPKPVKAQDELTFAVTLKGSAQYEQLTIDLTMPGMYMGKNAVIVKRRPDGTYTGKGIIPRCPSGRRLWRATLYLPGSAKVTYTFNVLY